jgi:hypothetical protein
MNILPSMTLLMILTLLSGCTPSKNTPSLPAFSSTPIGRPAAEIQNTEALDQALESDYTGPR